MDFPDEIRQYLPEYEKYEKAAPLKRNITIIESVDLVLAFWDGVSRGTKCVIDSCKSLYSVIWSRGGGPD